MVNLIGYPSFLIHISDIEQNVMKKTYSHSELDPETCNCNYNEYYNIRQ